jgi:predicted transcriptional regulator
MGTPILPVAPTASQGICIERKSRYPTRMRLSVYLAKNQLNPEQFAAKVGVHPTTIYRLLSGATIPKRQNLKKIIAATEGEVDIGDLMFAVSAEPKEAV